MQKRTLAAVAAVGMASAIAIPTIAFGNARRNEGTLAFLKQSQTPYVETLTGGAVAPGPGDTDGKATATLTFDVIDATDATTNGAQVCWDVVYSNIATPTALVVGQGTAGVAGTALVTATTGFTATSGTGCAGMSGVQASALIAAPTGFFVALNNTDFAAGALRAQLAAGPAPAGEIHMLATPLRAYDSRDNNGAKIGINEVRTISLATGRDGSGTVSTAVPPGATAAIVTLTVTETTVGPGGPGGFLTMYSAALAPVPATSSINWSAADQNIAVTAQVGIDANGQIKVRDGSNATHFVVDVIGYLF